MPKNDDERLIPAVALPADMLAQLLDRVGQLVERLDKEPEDDNSRAALTQILDTHRQALKAALSPEERLHHEKCYLHPPGRDEERPRLRRELYFLGMPNDPTNMHDDEIRSANAITESLEVPSRRWVARILKDQAGKEILYVSVPFQGFDDIRNIGGMKFILDTIATEGHRPLSTDVLSERLAQAERLIAELQASRSAADAPALVPIAP